LSVSSKERLYTDTDIIQGRSTEACKGFHRCLYAMDGWRKASTFLGEFKHTLAERDFTQAQAFATSKG
jgi:transposase